MMRILVACLAALALPSPAAEPLGRLFHTPEQRAALDRLRSHPPAVPARAEAQRPAEPPPRNVTYSGMVRRSDGRYTAWINNEAVDDRVHGASGTRARVDGEGYASIELPQQGRVRLKVGQTAELASGRVEEGYARPAPAPAAAEATPPRAEPALRLRRRFDNERELPPDERRP